MSNQSLLIDIPPSGGTHIELNGVHYYHGTTYEFDIHTIRTVKDIMHRGWKHESDINGSNENFYRRPLEQRIGVRG